MTDTPKRKKTAAKAAAADPAPVVEPVAPAVATTLRFKDYAEQVAQVSGVNRREVRSVLEAALGVLHSRLRMGEVLVLPPLGRLRVVKDEAGIRTIKLRDLSSAKGAKGAKEPLAGDDD